MGKLIELSDERRRELSIGYDLTIEQINNLNTLQAFLSGDTIPPPQFDIGSYMAYEVDSHELEPVLERAGETPVVDWYGDPVYNMPYFMPIYMREGVCGTTACAIGHGPLAGIPARKGEHWSEYCSRVFVGSETYAWDFMFGPMWRSRNNTAKGSAARIRWFLQYGVPVDFSHHYHDGEPDMFGGKPSPWLDADLVKVIDAELAVKRASQSA